MASRRSSWCLILWTDAPDDSAQLAVRLRTTTSSRSCSTSPSASSRTTEPAFLFEAVVAEANAAIRRATTGSDGSRAAATFVGVLVSADRAWYCRLGSGEVYLLGAGEARALLGSDVGGTILAPSDATETGLADPEHTNAASVLGDEEVEVTVDSADLHPGDALVLLGSSASSALNPEDVLGIPCVSCDAQVAATGLAERATAAEPAGSVTVALWSADSALYASAPVPEPEPVAPAVRPNRTVPKHPRRSQCQRASPQPASAPRRSSSGR